MCNFRFSLCAAVSLWTRLRMFSLNVTETTSVWIQCYRNKLNCKSVTHCVSCTYVSSTVYMMTWAVYWQSADLNAGTCFWDHVNIQHQRERVQLTDRQHEPVTQHMLIWSDGVARCVHLYVQACQIFTVSFILSFYYFLLPVRRKSPAFRFFCDLVRPRSICTTVQFFFSRRCFSHSLWLCLSLTLNKHVKILLTFFKYDVKFHIWTKTTFSLLSGTLTVSDDFFNFTKKVKKFFLF